jgi:hypothetical protein
MVTYWPDKETWEYLGSWQKEMELDRLTANLLSVLGELIQRHPSKWNRIRKMVEDREAMRRRVSNVEPEPLTTRGTPNRGENMDTKMKTEILELIRETLEQDPDGAIGQKIEQAIYGPEEDSDGE